MDEKNTGLLKIESKEDRVTVAAILYKNGYTVSPIRRKKNGKTYEYFVGYVPANPDDIPGGGANEG